MPSDAKKNIWIIKVAEPTPVDGPDARLFRCGMLAGRLAQAGHTVTWWHSTVHHQKRVQRYPVTTTVGISERYRIVFLHAPLYTKTVGLRRIVNQALTARAFRRHAAAAEPPDVIVCCLPPLELCREAVRYGARRGIPVIIDVQDLWPDAFLSFVPVWAQPLWKRMLTPWFRAVREACSRATAITGTTDSFVDWALGYAGRDRNSLDRAFPLAYQAETPEKAAIDTAEKRWRERGLFGTGNAFVTCFFGLFGRHYEIELVIEAVRRLHAGGRDIFLALCGTGEKLGEYKRLAAGCDFILLPGWVGEADIRTLLRRSAAGLCPYRSSATLVKNIPNKPIEYFSAGLPVVSSLRGELERLLAAHVCGMTYAPGDLDGLMRILADLYDNPEKRKRLAGNALRLFQERFAAEKVYAAMADHIEHISRMYRPAATRCQCPPT